MNDGMANTSIAALKAQGLAGKVLVTGQDAEVSGIRNILLGDQSMTIYKPIKKLATQLAASWPPSARVRTPSPSPPPRSPRPLARTSRPS